MRLLLVEDNHGIAHNVRDVLMAESFAVDVSYEGDEGLRTALCEDYDLIILDRMLPGGMDGIKICQELRKAGKHMPILMLTAKDQVRQRVEGLQSGADDYLVKPFSFEELLARIQALLRRPTERLQEILTIGDLTLDTRSKQVTRSGRPITLSAREYALLMYLMRNQGEVISKQEFVAHIWDFDADILPTTVESLIARLRAKIDKPFKKTALIHTVHGFGYKISLQS
jgi:DNA-binding response OmpR family regulator